MTALTLTPVTAGSLPLSTVAGLGASRVIAAGATQAEIQAIFDASVAGDLILWQPGTYTTASSLFLPAVDNLTIVAYGVTLTNSYTAAPASEILRTKLNGLSTVAGAVTVNVTRGDNTLTMDSTAGLSVGDLIYVASSDALTKDSYKKGELHKVRALSSTLVTLDDCFFHNPTAVSITVQRALYRTSNLKIMGLRILCANAGDNAFQLRYADGFYLRDMVFDVTSDGQQGLITQFSQDGVVDRCRARGFSDLATGAGRTGYGISIAGCNNIEVRDCYSADCKHNYAMAERLLVAKHITFRRNFGSGGDQQCYDAHSNAYDITWENNTAAHVTNGVVARNLERIRILNNTVTVCSDKAISVRGDAEDNIYDVQIVGNTIDRGRNQGIVVDAAAAGSSKLNYGVIADNVIHDSAAAMNAINLGTGSTRVEVRGNIIENIHTAGIFGTDLVGCRIHHNDVRNVGTAATANLVSLAGASVDNEVTDNYLKYVNANNVGVNLSGTSDRNMVGRNKFDGFGSLAAEIADTSSGTNPVFDNFRQGAFARGI